MMQATVVVKRFGQIDCVGSSPKELEDQLTGMLLVLQKALYECWKCIFGTCILPKPNLLWGIAARDQSCRCL